MKVNVIPDKLQSSATDIIFYNNELRNQMEQIEMLILSLNGDWQGDAERAFAGRILYVKNQFDHIFQFFDDYAELLKKLAAEYEESDKEISSKIQLV